MTASAAHSILPPLTPDEERHSRAAADLIRRSISVAGGWISFERFLELALYAPGFGYYSAGSVKLGKSGDFVTAPEVSDLFSRCVARQCADVLAETGGSILELGAGTGRMAATILEALADMRALPDRYAILEVSADLAERQRAYMQKLAPDLRRRVAWLDRLPEEPTRGVVLANEVLDALPFRRFVVGGGVPHELGVCLQGDSFAWQEGDWDDGRPNSRLASSAAEITPGEPRTSNLVDLGSSGPCMPELLNLASSLPDGYVSEICLRVAPWIAGVSQFLQRGALLLFDYGLPRSHYYHEQRIEGTLRCYFKHRAHDDPFINIAVQDITAWVDFTRVAEAAVDAGLDVTGFATQAAFLLGTGIEALVAAVTDVAEHARLAGEARRLLLPGEMGESFKVMALTRNLDAPLRGFAYQDLRASL
jgi:SAM-dependent MidA family methyltransferase